MTVLSYAIQKDQFSICLIFFSEEHMLFCTPSIYRYGLMTSPVCQQTPHQQCSVNAKCAQIQIRYGKGKVPLTPGA